jgi:hypothetical protein
MLRRSARVAAVAAGIAAFACVASRGRRDIAPRGPSPAPAILGLDGRPDVRPDAAFADVARKECGACHVPPSPADLPRAAWRQRLHEMARFSLTGVGLPEGRQDTLASLDLVPFIDYFEARAPETLAAPDLWPPIADGPVRFQRHLMGPPGAVPVPIVANTRLLDLDRDGRLEIVVCDMGHGIVLLGKPDRDPSALREIARLANPSHAAMVDLDRDGLQDLLVADVGFFLPEDNEKGAVVWLRADGKGGFEKKILAEKLPRVMDVEAADFDGDGDLDLVVAAFGLHTRGGILLLENRTEDWKEPRFTVTVLDPRPGTIHVSPADLDGDGRLDFVAVIAQQHETVVAFLNRGGSIFERRTVFTAPTPAWGATGIELADLDRDGDLDVLMTNGATLDDPTVKPYHGVRWLENRGAFPFTRHDLAALPGAHRAQAADLDGDGDLDVAVAAFLPDPDGVHSGLTSLGWLEQTSPGVFARHTLQAGPLSHTTLDLGDVDGDGDIDIVTGNFVGFTFVRAGTGTGFGAEGWVELWESLTVPQPRPRGAPAEPRLD